jgi:hypothetical protein
MSRLDRHVANVQNKLALRRFVDALAWTALIAGSAVFIFIFVWRILGYSSLPTTKWWLIGAGTCVLGVGIYALTRRPTAHDAAVAIDEKLKLHEKFSTALFVRPSKDMFAQAAVRDAERTAENVQLQRQFPIAFPQIGYGALTVFAAAFLLAVFMPPRERASGALAGSKPSPEKEQAQTKQAIEKALAVAETAPKYVTEDAKLKTEIASLTDLLKNKKFDDPAHAQHKAQEVLQDVQAALAEEAEKTQRTAMEQKKVFSPNFGDPKDYKSDTGKKVDEDLAKGDFKKASDDVGKMAEKFDKMSEEEKKKTADDVKKLAEKLANAANDPKVQQQIQDKLQQMGATQQQAQQMAQQMQQAAQGDKQAQQQVAQAAQQMQQQAQQQMQQLQQQAKQGNQQAQQQLAQMQQQQQQIQQAVKNMQAQANAQAQAQQMSQAAQQMAQAMQQQQQSQAGQQGQKGQQGQQAGQQQMANAQSQMQQAMQSMQAAQADADAVRASQQQAMKGDGQGDGPNGGQGGKGEGAQAGMQPQPGDQKKGEFKTGDTDKPPGSGSGGPGVSFGGQNRDKTIAGFDTKVEHDIGAEREDGKILASTLIKDNQPIKGTSKLGLARVTESAQKQATDDVDEDHVSGEARKAAEGYFRTMSQDAAPAPVAK